MNIGRKYRSFSMVLVSLLVVTAMPAPFAAEADRGSTLSGRVYSAAGIGVSGASVLAYHLSTEQLFTSDPTAVGGQYSLSGLPYGYFDIAVRTADGIFVADQVINIAPAAKSMLTLTLSPFGAGEPSGVEEPRAFPGTEEVPIGIARVSEKLRGAEFWRSKKGVSILAGAGGAALLLLSGGGGHSPSTP